LKNITNRLDQAEERVSGIEDKAGDLLYSDSTTEKKESNHDQNIQDFWYIIEETKPVNLWCGPRYSLKIKRKYSMK
jgi:hypothetical protein